MSAIASNSELPQGWSKAMTLAGYKTSTEAVYDDAWGVSPTGWREVQEPVFKEALVPPSPRFAVWGEVGSTKMAELYSTTSGDNYVEVERPVYGWKLLSREESGKVIAATDNLRTYIFNVDMGEYPEAGMEGYRRDIRAYLLPK